MAIVVDPTTTPGAAVDLTAVFLNDAADPADFLALEYAGDALSVNTTARVEVRQLVGRTRLVRRGTDTSESFTVTFEGCTREQAAWLRGHVGTLLCIRDHVGTKFFGVYAEAPREVDTRYPNHRDPGATRQARIRVSLTITQVTHSEAID